MKTSTYPDFLKQTYPSAYQFAKSSSWTPPVFSQPVSLSLKAYQEIKLTIKSLFQLKKREDYQQSLNKKAPKTALKNQKHDSVLMAYDFHIDQHDQPKLIEVNTNASGFLLVNSLYQFQNLSYKKAREDLKNSFQTEWRKFINKEEKVKEENSPQKTVLIDDHLFSQKMAVEFYMYKDFFQSMAWPFEVCEAQSLTVNDKGELYTSHKEKVDFIYNRSTDFYFKNHPHLAEVYLKGTCVISPHPREYYLLADKNRLCDWFIQKDKWEELKLIQNHLPFSEVLDSHNKERIWTHRKKYFFKPRQGYSGRGAYRGASLTHKKFEELSQLKSLVQDFIPPSTVIDSTGQKWKVDFRAYVYEDQIQQLAARVYQGQLTNFKQPGSGYATVILS